MKRIKCSQGKTDLIGSTGIQGCAGVVGLPMKEWMPAEQYAVMKDYMEGKISLENLKSYARKQLDILNSRKDKKGGK
jgi:hypothetical protein